MSMPGSIISIALSLSSILPLLEVGVKVSYTIWNVKVLILHK